MYPHSTHTHSPLDGLAIDSSGHRVLYCVIMGSWGADILANFLNRSLYYSSPFSITDSIYFFSECKEPNYTVPIVLESSNSICPNITFYCCVCYWCFFYGAVFTPTVIILSQSLAYFPVFACVNTTIPVLGHLLGLLYTSLL